MERFIITGMSCAACSARVEKAVQGVQGVTSVSVNLLTNSMTVYGTALPDNIINAVNKAGYGASVNADDISPKKEDMLSDTETPQLKKRLIFSLIFLVILMYISMGHKMWGWYLPKEFADNILALALTEMLLAIILIVINRKFFINGFKGLIHKSPNMDTLVALGAGASFAYSLYCLYAMTYYVMKSDILTAQHFMHDLYFESSGTILTLITLGKTLEAYSKGKTKDALRSLIKLAPGTAVLLKEGKEITVPVKDVKKGDIVAVYPGESIPVDGIIKSGHTSVNESALTGESIPADKAEGDMVSAATINQEGYITCEAVNVGEDTAISRIIQLVSDASASKAPIAKTADKVSGVFVPFVMLVALIAFVVWAIAGKGAGFALTRAVSVLVISCPCALGLATPVAIMVGNGKGASNGILFKNATALEETGKAGIVVLDKTGTVTKGEPKVTDIIPEENITKEELLMTALALEYRSEHPLAKAILDYGAGMEIQEVDEFKAAPGNGLCGKIGQHEAAGGRIEFISEKCPVSATVQTKAHMLSSEGKTPLFFMKDNKYIGCIAVADIIKEESRQTVENLKKMGLDVVMLTGDNARTAEVIGKQAGIDRIIANVLPEGKERAVRELKRKDKVIMVGDGINDAPALASSDVGIAIGAGTDVAIDAADIVLMRNSLTDIEGAIRLSRATLKNIRQNLFWAFFYNTIGIPLAAGVFIPVSGWQLNPMFGAAAMGLSSFCVVSNALRLNFVNIYKNKNKKCKTEIPGLSPKDKGTINEKENCMKKVIKIEGMMCSHCEAAVKKALEETDGVSGAEVSHEKGVAKVTLEKDVPDEILIKAIEEKDYKVTEIKIV